VFDDEPESTRRPAVLEKLIHRGVTHDEIAGIIESAVWPSPGRPMPGHLTLARPLPLVALHPLCRSPDSESLRPFRFRPIQFRPLRCTS
jgi:hypothetical protein